MRPAILILICVPVLILPACQPSGARQETTSKQKRSGLDPARLAEKAWWHGAISNELELTFEQVQAIDAHFRDYARARREVIDSIIAAQREIGRALADADNESADSAAVNQVEYERQRIELDLAFKRQVLNTLSGQQRAQFRQQHRDLLERPWLITRFERKRNAAPPRQPPVD